MNNIDILLFARIKKKKRGYLSSLLFLFMFECQDVVTGSGDSPRCGKASRTRGVFGRGGNLSLLQGATYHPLVPPLQNSHYLSAPCFLWQDLDQGLLSHAHFQHPLGCLACFSGTCTCIHYLI